VSAANALLKTLEEPGARTHFILLSAQPETLLPTIRSRTQRVRFGALPDAVVEALLTERETPRAQEIARLAGGSMTQALSLADPDDTDRREAFVGRALGALEARDVGASLELAEEAKKSNKDFVTRLINALAAAIAARARDLASQGGDPLAAESWARRYPLCLAAIEQIEGNASTQLVVEAMLLRMRAA
jgi:DNA polymerase-3 subunit delta'